LTNTTDELVTLKATQTLENKTIASPTFTGSLTIESFTSSGNATIGDAAADSLTVNAAATFAASTTFSNSVIMNQGSTITGDVTLNGNLDMRNSDTLKLGDDDDLLIYHLAAGSGGNYIAGANNMGIVISAEKVELLNQGHSSYYFKGEAAGSIVYHNNSARVTTTATGIQIGGAIDAVTSITGSGDIAIATDKFTLDSATGNAVFGGNITGGGNVTATAGTTFQLGSTASAKLGIGRAASTYNLEVEGSIYSTGSTIIAGNGSAGKFILQKGAAAIGTHFTNNVGTDEMVLDSNANLGIGKSPGQRLDVSGNANIDGDLVIVTTNPSNNTGGKISAREVVLTDPITGSQSTLNYATSGGVSRARVFFTNM